MVQEIGEYTMLEITFNLIIPILLLLFIFIAHRQSKQTYKLIKKTNDITMKNIEHLYILTNILAEGLCSPMHKQMFRRAFKDGPEATSKNLYSNFEDLKEVLFENYSKGRKNLLKEKEKHKGNPKIEEKFQVHITELDNVLNLLSSVDNKTSRGHLQTIMYEINIPMMKLSKGYKDLK